MKQIIKIMFIVMSMIILIGCTQKSQNTDWEIIKSFKSLPNLVEDKDFRNIRIGFLNDKIGFAINKSNRASYSNNGGEQWSDAIKINNPCIAMDIINEKDIIIGCDSSRIQYSNDSGKTWFDIEESNYPLISFYNSNSGMIAKAIAYNIVKIIKNYKAVNEIKLPKEYERISITSLSCVSENIAYILFYGEGPLLRTQDGGKTWEVVDINVVKGKSLFKSTDATSMRFSDINNGKIVTYNNKEKSWVSLMTDDGGKSWKYSKLPATSRGLKSYLSKDGNYLTIVNEDKNENPIMLLKRKI